MKILDQCILVWRDGSTERVHEVDLVEVSRGQCVVNFRYGKRGSVLKDGSRTVLPIPMEEARRTYEWEIKSKQEKGYVLSGGLSGGGAAPRPGQAPAGQAVNTGAGNAGAGNTGAAIPRPVLRVAPALTVPEVRRQAILARLAEGDNPTMPAQVVAGRRMQGTARFVQRHRIRKPRPLNRVILRAGELRLREAEPLLLGLLAGADAVRTWCIARALGRLGGDASVEALIRLGGHAQEWVRRQGIEALRLLSDEASRAGLAEDRTGRLPAEVQGVLRAGKLAEAEAALDRWLAQPRPERVACLYELYLIDSPAARALLQGQIRKMPLRPPWFKVFRQILKAAEYRLDGEVFGLCAWRLETTQAMFCIGRERRRGNAMDRTRPIPVIVEGKKRTFVRAQLGQVNAELAYSDRTRWYLRQRTWRVLRRLGKAESADFVKMAVGALLPFRDGDAVAAKETQSADPQNWRRRISHRWGVWAPYFALNHLLFLNSPRYFRPKRRRSFQLREGYQDSRPVHTREEAFVSLWDGQPAGFLHLLMEAQAGVVHDFAARGLNAHPSLIDGLDRDVAVALLARPYDATAAIGLRVARRLYRAEAPDVELVLAAAEAAHGPARSQAWIWVRERAAVYLAEARLLARLAGCAHADTRTFARELIAGAVAPGGALTDLTARALLARLVGELRRAEPAVAADICLLLGGALRGWLREVGAPVWLELLGSKHQRVQEFAAAQVLGMEDVPEEVLGRLLASEHATVRSIGRQVLGRIPAAVLAARPGLLLAMAVAVAPDLREGARPMIAAMVRGYPAEAGVLASMLAEVLLREQAEAVAPEVIRDVLALFREVLGPVLGLIPLERMWSLIRSKRAAAQEAGGLALAANTSIERLDFPAITSLAGHEVLAVRQASWAVLERNRAFVEKNLGEAIRVLDAKWEDSRAFAFRYFREQIPLTAYTPEVLVAMADSVREDVQAFAQQMLLAAFREEDGATYLLRLAEHPSARMQGMAVGYLEGYAAGQPERLRALTPLFRSVLCRVNRGRVAKARLFAFLRREAAAGGEAEQIVAEILGPQSLTMAIGDKAAGIGILLEIRRRSPQVDNPLTIAEIPLRPPRGAAATGSV